MNKPATLYYLFIDYAFRNLFYNLKNKMPDLRLQDLFKYALFDVINSQETKVFNLFPNDSKFLIWIQSVLYN